MSSKPSYTDIEAEAELLAADDIAVWDEVIPYVWREDRERFVPRTQGTVTRRDERGRLVVRNLSAGHSLWVNYKGELVEREPNFPAWERTYGPNTWFYRL